MSCSGCMNLLNDNNFLKCNACRSGFCFECLSLDHDQVSTLNTKQLAALQCPSCANVNTRRRNDDSSPARAGLSRAPSLQKPLKKNSPKILMNPTSAPVPLTIEMISALFDQKLSPSSATMVSLRSALREDVQKMITVELDGAVQRLKDDFTRTTDFIMGEQRDLSVQINEKNQIIKSLETEQSEMHAEINRLNSRLVTLEKISRENNIEIQAVPENRNENVLSILKEICQTLNTPLLETDIRACRRVAKINTSSGRPRNILATLTSPRLRDDILSAAHRYNKEHPKDLLNSGHAGINGEPCRIYLAEHSSPELKQLHGAARQFARDKNFKFVWVKFGNVYLRKDVDANAIRVKNMDHLKTLS